MMPGMPLAKDVARFHVAVQCSCGWAMYNGREDGDMCSTGQITCLNPDCHNHGKPFVAPTVDVQRVGRVRK